MFKSKNGLGVLGFWVETFFVIFIAIGALIGFAIRNALLSYTVIFLCSIVTASIIYKKKEGSFGLYALFTISFAMGYIIANRVANPILLLAVFITGNILSYQAFSKKLIKLI